jgi:hypothetical protein
MFISKQYSFEHSKNVLNGNVGRFTIMRVFIGKFDWSVDYLLFYVLLNFFFHFYGDITITDEGLQDLGLCSAHRAFEQEGIYPTPTVARKLDFSSHIRRTVPFSRLSQYAWGCRRPILSHILTGFNGKENGEQAMKSSLLLCPFYVDFDYVCNDVDTDLLSL